MACGAGRQQFEALRVFVLGRHLRDRLSSAFSVRQLGLFFVLVFLSDMSQPPARTRQISKTRFFSYFFRLPVTDR